MKKYLFTIVLISWSLFAQAQDFITRWDLSIAGSGATQLTFGVGTSGTCSYTWETIPAGTVGSGTFSGNTIKITGLPAGAMIRLMIDTTNFRRIFIDSGLDRSRLLDVEQWGNVSWINMSRAFYGCNNLNISSIDTPILLNVVNMESMFRNCISLNGPSNINSWNTTNVTNMSYLYRGAKVFNQFIGDWNTQNVINMSGMFQYTPAFNQPIGNFNTTNVTNMSYMFADSLFNNQPTAFNQSIGNWNTSNVTNMSNMFLNADLFNQPIGNWNTQNVLNMGRMFIGAVSFNQPIGNWNVSNVTDMNGMFYNAMSFNQPIGNWNTSNVTIMSGMFIDADNFNQPIDNWNTSNVTIMSGMFENADNFNQPIGNWNTQNVIDFSYMFYLATSFNQPIGNWNTSNVLFMISMFRNTVSFNQPIGIWNTSNVINMSYMFKDAISFNQPIGTWQLKPTVNLSSMLNNSGMDCANYSATLSGWGNNPNIPSNRTLGALNMKYFISAQNDRNYLINSKGWTIMGDNLAINNCCTETSDTVNVTGCNSFLFNGQTLTNSGTYYDTLMNANGCDSLITMNLTINQIDTSVMQSGANLTANAIGCTYQWLTCNNPFNPFQILIGETNQNYLATANGEYAVVVSQNGCTDTSACYTVVGIGTNTFELSNNIKIYPNPVFHTLQVEAENEIQFTSVKLIDITGKVLLERASSSFKKISIDMSSYSSGNYFIQITNPDFSYVKKIYKE
jgi:surface protein